MDYVDYFLGGPRDGVKRASQAGERYPKYSLRQSVEVGPRILALYQFEGARILDGVTERTYRYQRSMPSDEAQRFFADHNVWHSD